MSIRACYYPECECHEGKIAAGVYPVCKNTQAQKFCLVNQKDGSKVWRPCLWTANFMHGGTECFHCGEERPPPGMWTK